MTTVVTDLTQRCITTQDRNGYYAERFFLVDGITAGTVDARLYNALLATGIPDYGDAHPTITGLYVVSRRAEPAANNPAQMLVSIVYREPDPVEQSQIDDDWLVEFQAGTQSELTRSDYSGTLMEHTQGTTTWFPTVEVWRPQLQVRCTHFGKTKLPGNLVDYVGKLNNATWNGDAAKKWMCTSLSGPEDGSRTEMVFDYNADDWRFHHQVTVTVGATTTLYTEHFDMYGTANFGTLGISF